MVDVPKFDAVREAVLFQVYLEIVKGESFSAKRTRLSELFEGRLSHGYIFAALNELNSLGLVESGTSTINITSKGIYHVEECLEKDDTYISLYDKNGFDSLFDIRVGKSGDKETQEDADNEEWTPLIIDREAPEYAAAVEATEEALKAIEGDNGYAANEPQERDQIVWSIRQGLEVLKERVPSRAQIRSLLSSSLKFIATKFASTVIGEAAKVALTAIKIWLSTL